MGAIVASVGEPGKQAEILSQMDALRGAVDKLEKRWSHLVTKTSPVVSAPQVPAVEANPAPDVVLCDVAAWLRTERRRVEAINDSMLDVLHRIEL